MHNKIISIVISIIILTLSICFVLFKKQDFSYNENRYLTLFPKYDFIDLKTGKYLTRITEYLQDHFPFKTTFMNIKTESLLLLKYKEISNVYISNEYLIEKYNEPKNTNRLISKLNDFKKNVDVDMELLLVPTSISIYNEYLPKHSSNSQIDTMNYIYDNITFKYIDVYNILKENKSKYQLYYYLDHHWTTYGAYYAYKEFCIQNNIKYYNIEDFTIKKVTDDFMGTIYSKVLKLNNKKDSIYRFILDNTEYTVDYGDKVVDTLYDESYLNKKDKYSYFLSNNNSITIIENSSDLKGTLLVVKDSYANSMIPFLVNHYKKIVVIDPRYYKDSISEYINNNDISKVLFVYNMNTIDEDTGLYTID